MRETGRKEEGAQEVQCPCHGCEIQASAAGELVHVQKYQRALCNAVCFWQRRCLCQPIQRGCGLGEAPSRIATTSCGRGPPGSWCRAVCRREGLSCGPPVSELVGLLTWKGGEREREGGMKRVCVGTGLCGYST